MIGKSVSHYTITEKLGGGGMGVVYKARDTHLDRTVALKFLPPHLSTSEHAKERFIHEAKSASALDHPNICTIHDIDSTDEGQLFIAMAYYSGETLKERLRRGRASIEESLDVAVQVAKGLCQAHEAGIVHRDIKPANLMLTDQGEVKILDFGLAKVPDKDLTESGTLVGTAAYMSPEQVRGEKVDGRTDVWSLGVVLYEMLTGGQPFRGEHGLAVIQSISKDEPTPLRTRNEDVPDALARVVHRAIAKKREVRYGSMPELLEDLRSVRAELGISDTDVSGLKPLSRQLRRPVYAVPILIVLLALGFLAVSAYRGASRARWARQEALPEIQRLADTMSWSGEGPYSWSAYELALEAQQAIPDDRLLGELWPEFSREVKIDSDPPGAKVYAKAYSTPESEWRLLGSTPIGPTPFPLGFSRLKLEQEGFRPVFDLLWNNFVVRREEWLYKLHKEGSLPDEMVYFTGEASPLRIPGLGHLSAEPLGDFLMDRYEVTNKEYKRFVESGGYTKKEYWQHPFILDGRTLSWEEALALFVDRTGRPGPSTWEVGDYPKGEDDYPVSGVSWYEAAAYAAFVEKSLPTIFHWNQAAFTWATAEILPFCNLDGRGPAAVGSRSCMHRSGTYDLAGNVREWSRNATRLGERFILGGGWNDPTYAFTDAYAQSPFDRSPTNGFRCIRYLETDEDHSRLTREIELPFRDFFQEKPVPDEIFEVFLKQYDYDRTDLDAVIDEEDDTEDWTRQKTSFNAAYGSERMFAHLFLPKKGKPPYQTVVCFPGSTAIHDRDSSDLPPPEFILKGGRAVMFPIYKGTYERGDELDSDYQAETTFYREHVIMWVKDFSRSIDYLETRDDIDTEKLAYFGVSWGGNMGAIVPSVEKRLKASVLYIAGLQFQKALPEADAINYVTRVTLPTLMLNGESDFFFPVETSQRPMFELLGTPEKDKKWLVYPGGHSVPRVELTKETLDWLDRYLGPVE